MTISTDIFIHDLILNFPEIKDKVLDEDYLGLFSQQIGCFREFTQKAIDNNDINLALKCFKFVAEYLPKVIFEVENSLVISWMTKLDFSKNKSLEKLLPPDFIKIRKQFEDHYTNQSANEKINAFLRKNDLKGIKL